MEAREVEVVWVIKKETYPLGGTWGGAGQREILLGVDFILSS